MLLKITGLPPLSNPNHFENLFGRYLYGFKPWAHCQHCFSMREETQIHPRMTDGDFKLHDDLFYLCGVGRNITRKATADLTRRSTNVHLAVLPRKGSVAAIGSVYGATFVIEDALAISIQAPTRSFPAIEALPDPQRTKHARCRMFHFAYQMFQVDDISLTKSDPVHLLREEWRNVPGIQHDGLGNMSDPKLRW